MPYLLGTERLKGSHSMSAYHNTELCYLAAVYTNLLITKQPLDLHFKPRADACQGPHPPRLARHPPARLDPDRPGLDRRAAVVGVRRRAADGHAAAARQGLRGQGARRLGARDVRERGAGLERHRLDHAHRQARRDGHRDARARSRAGARRQPAARRAAGRAARVDVERRRAGAALPAAEAAVRGRRPRTSSARSPRSQEACRLVDADEQSFVFVDDIKKLKPLK